MQVYFKFSPKHVKRMQILIVNFAEKNCSSTKLESDINCVSAKHELFTS